MTAISRLAAAVGSLVLLASGYAHAQGAKPLEPVGRVAAVAAGSIEGVVQDETGAPVAGALVSAVGATPKIAVTDRSGRFELRTLSPGPYLVRAHLSGFAVSRGQMVDVRPSGRTSSSISLRHASSTTVSTGGSNPPVLEAGVGLAGPAADPPAASDQVDETSATADNDDDHSELAWRLRHLRRSVLRDVDAVPVADGETDRFAKRLPLFGGGSDAPTTLAASLFWGTPFSGQFNLLTTSAFDNPQQLFSSDNVPRSVAYLSVGAPAGSRADWSVRGALSQADLSAWVVAGSYSTSGSARHHYDIGLSYATERYDGGNPAALRDVRDGSRNAGAVYGFDTVVISPTIGLTYGGRYARYDYLEVKSLFSPRMALTFSPGDHFRISTLASRRAVAPGAEEFLPPGDNGIWLPPQRTFSSLATGRPLSAERTNHFEIAVERDLGDESAVSVRAFQQRVVDQLITMFGINVPGQPPATVGHYFVGNFGDLDARGVTAAFRTAIARRVQGSVEYSLTRARWNPGDDRQYWMLQLPSAAPLHAGRIHDVATTIETEVPETSTRVLVLYRVSNAFARRTVDDEGLLGSRFDVQVRQSLPFLDFSAAKWEMLVGVRNFFRETAADQSVYDELLVVHPPKRIVGGLTMRF